LRRLLARPIRRAAAVPGADRYRKHFPAVAHLWFLVWHGANASPSLRQSHAMLMADPALWGRLGMPPMGISRSQLARSSTSRPPACLEQLFITLQAQLPTGRTGATRWGSVHLVDSTFLTLSAQLAPWSRYGKHAPGVRVHTGFNLALGIPDHLRFSLTDTHDVRAFRERDWTAWRGWTVVMDLGYDSHQVFATLRQAQVSWLCPLHAQARVIVTAARTGPWARTPTGDDVIADQTITLGSPNNRKGAVVPDVRLVTSRNAHGVLHQTVTDRVDLPATEIVTLYRQRWQIDLFFRWLKHQLGVLHPLGYSPQAILHTLFLAAIIAVLASLLASDRPRHLSDIAWVRMLGQILLLTLRRGG
jgi:hypothetical protein